jgi:hypothetical protein
VTKFCREAILSLNSKEVSSIIIAQRWWPRWSERSNSAGFVWWILFFCAFCMADILQDMPSKKHSISSACWFSAFHSQTLDIRDQTSDIFIGFLTSSPTARR